MTMANEQYIAVEKTIDFEGGCITSPSITIDKEYQKFLVIDEKEKAEFDRSKTIPTALAALAARATTRTSASK